MIPSFTRKKRIKRLYKNPPKDGRVICVDEFGPLSIRPYTRKGWFLQKKANRLPATYTRTHGVRHLFAALDLKTDKLYAQPSDFKGFWVSFKCCVVVFIGANACYGAR